MKKLLCFLLFVMSLVSFSQDSEELPRELWEDIFEIGDYSQGLIRKWNSDIYIKLEGNYTIDDSLKVTKSIVKLDSLTEDISIQFAGKNKANFKIFFLDSFDRITSRTNNTNGQQQETELYIYNPKMFPKIRGGFSLEYKLTHELVAGYYAYDFKRTTRESREKTIFHPSYPSDYLSKNDMAIIKEIYSPSFYRKLEKAKDKYKYVLEQIENGKKSRRDRSLWWVRNPIAIILLPTLMLFLLFLFCIKKAKRIIDFKIKHDWLRFTLTALIVLVFLDIIIIFYVSFYDFLKTPNSFGFSLVRFDTVITTIVFSLILFPFVYLFRFIEFKIQKSSRNIYSKTSLIFLSTAFLPLSINFILMYLSMINKASNTYDSMYLKTSYIFLFLIGIALIRALVSFFLFKERELIVENEIQMSHLRELKTQAELKSLQSQINPHFLYNSLNSIASLAPVDTIKTQKMAYSLSDLFKYSINRKGKKMSTIQDEINMVNSYLEIEKIRFGDRLQFKIEVEKSILTHEVPLFLIQPLVENAIKHGVSKNKDEGEITLKIEEKENQLLISVLDNGPNFPEGLVSGHGLQTVYDLLRLSYQDQAMLNWTNEPQKMIQITIPQNL